MVHRKQSDEISRPDLIKMIHKLRAAVESLSHYELDTADQDYINRVLTETSFITKER